MIPAAFYRSAFCCSLVPAGLANTNFPHKGIIKIGNDFSPDYSVYYSRFLSTYVYYIIHDDVHAVSTL